MMVSVESNPQIRYNTPVSDPAGAKDATDAELVDRVRQGDSDAVEALYLRHREWAYRTAYGFVGNPQDAQEVAQDVFRQFFAKIDRYQKRAKLTTFLYTVVKHRSIDLIRKRKPNDTLVFDPVAPAQRDEAAERRALLDMVHGLSEKHREVVVLRFGEGLQIDEIAGRLDIASGTVKSRLHHALNTLRSQLKPRQSDLG